MLQLLVVDGYNVIHKSWRYMRLVEENPAASGDTDPLDRARTQLISDVAAFAQGTYEPVVVFDAAGNVSPDRPNLAVGGVKTIFSRTGQEADRVIERLVTEARQAGREVTLITSDTTIRATVGGIPVTGLSSDVLIDGIETLVSETARVAEERGHHHMTIEDRIDPETRARLNELLGRG